MNSEEIPAFKSMAAKSLAWRDYLEICKPRVVMLMLLTSVVGMCLASPTLVPLSILVWGNVGIALAAGAAAAVNHVVDQHIDKLMGRTCKRPLAQGKLSTAESLIFSALLCVLSMVILGVFVNFLTALLTFASTLGYAVFYTVFLKHRTPQNIVIGGLAGAAPPLLGWTAVTGHVAPEALLLVLMIFVWTPPHFWALAIYRVEDYAKAQVPMLPNTHGIPYTKLHVLLYTLLLCAVTLLPFACHMTGWVYLMGVLLINGRFLYWACRLYTSEDKLVAMKTFKYSIIYLGYLFLLLLLDHYI